MNKKPMQPQDKYVVRLPDGMRDRIKAAARVNNRSMNAEILARLEADDPTRELIEGYLKTQIDLRNQVTQLESEVATLTFERDSYVMRLKDMDARRQALADELQQRIDDGIDVMIGKARHSLISEERLLDVLRPLLSEISERLEKVESAVAKPSK